MAWLLLVLLSLGCAACYALGVWMGTRPRRLILAAGVPCAALIVLRVFFRYFPDVEFSLLPWNAYARVRTWWPFPLAFFVLGIGVFQMTASWRRVMAASVAGLAFLWVVRCLYANATFDPDRFRGVPGADQVCPQTTPYSCGAAASATLLALEGVATSEREMAELCATNPVSGTDEFAVVRGLRRKLPGHPVRILRTDWEGLRGMPLPAMATMKANLLVDHWVVIVGMDDSTVEIADPLEGRCAVGRAWFLSRWRGVLVVTEGR